MKIENIIVKKVKNGYWMPPHPLLDNQVMKEFEVEIKIKTKNKNTKEKQIRDKSYKELRDEALWERYLEKEKRNIQSHLSEEAIDSISENRGLTAESLEDLLRLK